MPYETVGGTFERAGRLSHQQAILRALADKREFHVPAEALSDTDWLDGRVLDVDDLLADSPAGDLATAIAIDGSHMVEAIRPGMPSVLYGFAQAAAASVDLAAMAQQQAAPFTDPVAISQAVSSSLVSVDLPTSGAYAQEGMSIRQSWRHEVLRLFSDRKIELQRLSKSLLDLLFELRGTPGKPATQLPVKCFDCGADRDVPRECLACSCGALLRPTDTLRLDETVTEDGGNGEALGRMRSVIELLVLVGIITLVWERSRKHLASTVFLVDGPLAMYGEPAKLRRWALDYFQAMGASTDGAAPFICGIEKTGAMVDFATRLADHELVKPRQLVICDEPVLRRIVGSDNTIGYGSETYWGRKFIYRSADGRVVVLTIPPDAGAPYDGHGGQPGPAGYSTLTTILKVVDRTGSSMYRNGLIPVAVAHGKAAFPIGVGTDVLRLVSTQTLGLQR